MQLFKGGQFTDHRGTIRHVNEFDFTGVKRFYTIYHKDTETIRAWQGHKVESKYFYVIKGSFRVNWIKIDNWQNPSMNTIPKSIVLSEKESQLIKIERGYANGFKALEPDSIIMVFSDKSLEQSLADSYRWVADYFVNAEWS